MNKPYPNKLKEYRLKAGLTQKQVAALLGLKGEDRLIWWEKGKAIPKIETWFQLAAIYNVEPYELYKMEDVVITNLANKLEYVSKS